MPAWLAFSVVRLLEEHFARLVDYEFTAGMEDVLDQIAARRGAGRAVAEAVLLRRGDGRRAAAEAGNGDGDHLGGLKSWSPSSARSTPASCRRSRSATASCCGSAATARTSSAATKDAEGHQRANVPDDLPPDELTLDRPRSCSPTRPARRRARRRPRDRAAVVAKNGRYGPYVTEVLPEDAPKTARTRQAAHRLAVQVDVARHGHARRRAQAAVLPRVVGTDAGRATRSPRRTAATGPYLKKGTDSRSLETEDQLLHDHPRRGAGDLRPAQAARPGRGRAAAEGARHRPGQRASRSWSRTAGSGRTSPTASTTPPCAQDDSVEDDHPGAGRRAARREARQGPGQEDGEEGGGEEDPGQEGRAGEEGRGKKTTAAKKATAKKTAGEEGRGQEGDRREGHGED